MKRLNLIYTTAFVFSCLLASAQVNETPVHTGGGQVTLMREKSQSATGSMFISEKYMPAKVSSDNQTVLARYNAYSDHFEISNPQAGTNNILPKQNNVIITFVSTGEAYTMQEYVTDKDETINGYLNIVSEDENVKIFKRERIHLQPEVFPANSYQSYKPANYKKVSDEFYIKIKDQQPRYFSSKKDLAKLIPTKNKEILNFIKENKISVDEEQDLQRLSGYINSIL